MKTLHIFSILFCSNFVFSQIEISRVSTLDTLFVFDKCQSPRQKLNYYREFLESFQSYELEASNSISVTWIEKDSIIPKINVINTENIRRFFENRELHEELFHLSLKGKLSLLKKCDDLQSIDEANNWYTEIYTCREAIMKVLKKNGTVMVIEFETYLGIKLFESDSKDISKLEHLTQQFYKSQGTLICNIKYEFKDVNPNSINNNDNLFGYRTYKFITPSGSAK